VAAPLLWSAVLAVLPVAARAEQTAPPSETLIRLTVSPMPAPKPALRYQLLPELKEMAPGNPIPNYLKSLLDQDFTSDQETFGRAALRQADRAARMDRPDWQLLPKVKTDGISLLLPDVQKMRALANGLQGRFREEIALGRVDDAIATAKTMFAMARHMNEHPTLIGNLVGIAMAVVTIAPLEELLEQPGCPNLYWALTNLPHPLVSTERGMEGERVFMLAELKDLSQTDPMTAGQVDKVLKHIDFLRKFEPGDRNPLTSRAWVNLRARDEKSLAAARRRIVEYGIAEQRAAKFPPEQVTLLDELREYETRRDEEVKLSNLPTWEFAARATRTYKKPDAPPLLFDLFLPAIYKVRLAQGRLEQRIALLRTVEGLRMYAAEHGGAWPAKLSDVSVPVPLDPFTGKSFRYEVSGSVAHLRGSPPPGEEKNAPYNLHYELTLRK
jgi:hypothetical protein